MSDDNKEPVDKLEATFQSYVDYFLTPHHTRDRAGNITPDSVDPELLKSLEKQIDLHFKDSRVAVEKVIAEAEKAIAAIKEVAEAGDALEAPPVPPPFGEALVGLFCKRDMREAVLGDLDEKFAELAERRGAKVAKAWYWSQAARSALFFAVRWGRRLLELEAILRRIL